MKNNPAKKKTRTSAFGTRGRISHDASAFYAGKLYSQVPPAAACDYIENPVPPEFLNTILAKSSESMAEIPDNSVHLMVTSPPYNVGKDYDEDLTLEEYLEFLQRVWQEVYRVLVPGGRACINIANLGRKPYIPLHAYIIQDMAEIGFLMRGEIIWNKAASASLPPPGAVGSLRPTRRSGTCMNIFRSFPRRGFPGRTPARDEPPSPGTNSWSSPRASGLFRRCRPEHRPPCPVSVDLPYRLIQLYTYKGEVVLDPFMGSGQTAIAALQSNRHYLGYEIESAYARLAEKRIKQFKREVMAPSLLDLLPERCLN